MKKTLSWALGAIAVLSSVMPIAAPAASAQTASSSSCHTFTANLGEGRYLSSADTQGLQMALTAAGVWTSGAPITTYNDAVASAVSGFQEKYAAEILTPNGLSYGTGFVGASTRAELNKLYGCPSASTSTSSVQCPAGYTCTPITPNTAPACPAGYVCTPVTASTIGNGFTSSSGQSTGTSNSSNSTLANDDTSNGSFWITSISPSSGSAGQTMTLTGRGFSSQTQVVINNSLFTAGIGGPVSPSGVSADGTSLTFVMPASLASGLYLISAENVSGSNAPSSNYVQFSIGAAANPHPSFSLADVPSIVRNDSPQNAQGIITSTYTATFDVNATAGYAPLTFGLANATIPAFDVTPSFVAIYKNGVQDELSNYNLKLSYTAPVNNVNMSSDGSAFLVEPGQTAKIPVIYSFSVANPGANTYAVELEGVRSWSGLDSSMAGSATWRTGSI